MMLRLGLIVIVLGTLGADEPSPAAKKELQAIAGTWKIMAATKNGNEVPEADRAKMSVQFENDVMTFTIGDNEEKSRVEIDPTMKQLKFIVANGAAPGIYALDGDMLKICWVYPGNERPKAFESKPGSETMLLILKREKK